MGFVQEIQRDKCDDMEEGLKVKCKIIRQDILINRKSFNSDFVFVLFPAQQPHN